MDVACYTIMNVHVHVCIGAVIPDSLGEPWLFPFP